MGVVEAMVMSREAPAVEIARVLPVDAAAVVARARVTGMEEVVMVLGMTAETAAAVVVTGAGAEVGT